MYLFTCENCESMIEEIKPGKGCYSCCGLTMYMIEPGLSDGAFEKHVPVYCLNGNRVFVKVGSESHPMLGSHYIEWIAIETTHGMQRKFLRPGDKPEAEFMITDDEEITGVYEYCSLHGLWTADNGSGCRTENELCEKTQQSKNCENIMGLR